MRALPDGCRIVLRRLGYCRRESLQVSVQPTGWRPGDWLAGSGVARLVYPLWIAPLRYPRVVSRCICGEP